jgi:glycosyltransferase involved in cell wall biosynthesis
MKKVSIIIPVYNTEKYIGKAIASVLNQTYTNLELILVDDASTDNTYEVCEAYAQKDERIRLYRNEHNLGMMPNWNHALEYVTGEYWGKLDADDWWDTTFIEQCVNVLDNQPDVGMVCGRYVLVDEKDDLIPDSEYQLPEAIKNRSTDFVWKVKKGVYGMFDPVLTQQGNGLIRTDIIKKLGNYTLLPAGDTELYFRIGAHYKIFFIDSVMHYHRVWAENYTRTQVLASGKLEKNLYDVRKTIFNFYKNTGKITEAEFRKFMKENDFELNKFLIANYRKSRSFLKMLSKFGANLMLFPLKTIKFYFGRFAERKQKASV